MGPSITMAEVWLSSYAWTATFRSSLVVKVVAQGGGDDGSGGEGGGVAGGGAGEHAPKYDQLEPCVKVKW